jgi:hypothetical protein
LPSYTAWDDAQLLQNVKPKISLKAGRELIFATYAPGCASLECLRKVTLQCWVDVAGTALTVNTRFSGEEVVGKTCTKDCEETTASCRTPALHPGTYTLTYGGRQKTIRIPGVVQPTCLPLE